VREVLATTLNLPSAPAVAATQPLPGQLWHDYLQTADGSLFALRSSSGTDRPLVYCHGSTGSATGLREHMHAWIGRRPLLAIDLPGNGESERRPGWAISVENQADALAAAIDSAGYGEVDLIGVEGGAAVAAELALRRPGLVHRLSLTGAAAPALFATAVELDDHGLHLLRVWNIVRDQLLYAPWHQRKRPNVLVPSADALSAARLHQRTLDVLKCLDALPQIEAAHCGYPLEAAMAALSDKLLAS
jgi:pimeloyl-ACP methyl ester carboxylesterase